MDQFTATEQAYKNGRADGEGHGYAAGFAAGLEAAGIAPIQWRDVKDLPFRPEKGQDYLVVFAGVTHAKTWSAPILALVGISEEDVRFWCPIQMPAVDDGGDLDG